MHKTTTEFNRNQHHIHVEFFVKDPNGVLRSFDGIFDTGASRTEFNDVFLKYAGFVFPSNKDISVKEGLQTQKYAKIDLPYSFKYAAGILKILR